MAPLELSSFSFFFFMVFFFCDVQFHFTRRQVIL